MIKKPRVSVLMSVYNAEKYVGEAIESILKQDYENFEFIIINDGSIDSSEKIIKKFKDPRIVYIKQKNMGLSKSLNKGMKICRGQYIARMDADDVSLPTRLGKEIDFLERNKEIDLVGTFADIINSRSRIIGEIKLETSHDNMLKVMIQRSQLIHPSVMFRKKSIQGILFSEKYRFAQDYDFFSRVIMKHKCANISEKLLKYRWDFNQNMCFTNGKKHELESLIIRWDMITKYGYPKEQIIHLIRPLISILIPFKLKKIILKKMYSKK